MRQELLNGGLLTIGAMIQGVSMALFLFPHGIPSGGAAGVAILLNHWFRMPHGAALWLANFALLTLALYSFGYRWTLRTMYSVTVTSYTVHVFELYVYLPHVHLFFDLICGGLVFGIGVGILIRFGASSGGMVIPSLIIATRMRYPPGKVMFWLNMTIFIVASTVIDWKIAFYAIFCQWFSTQIIDAVYKFNFRRLFNLLRLFV
mgnify:CR=1 FL=1